MNVKTKMNGVVVHNFLTANLGIRTLFGWLSGNTKSGAGRRPRFARLAVETLEAREVPAAFTFANGVFTINMAEVANRNIVVTTNNNGEIRLNGQVRPIDGAPNGVNALAVTQIVVNGSAQGDVINLAGVDNRKFGDLNGRVDIYGRGGNDTIYGTQFDDRIWAGAGNDKVVGGGGHDRIWGDAGHDTLWGDGSSNDWDWRGGNDRIDGGEGNDILHGNGGDDLLIGSGGKDTFWGGLGTDTVCVDGMDVKPDDGWDWAGIEIVRTGRPPRI